MKLLLFLLLPCLAFGQIEFVEKKALTADSFIGVDSYGNYYSLSNNALVKTALDQQFNYADFTLGKITEVDIINPLRILVYYADFNIVVFLDNTLNEIERINFNEVEGYLNIETVRLANNNSVWVFNKDNQQVELYNYRSGNRTVISQPVSGNLRFTASDFNFIHLLTDEEIITYNVYGSIISQYRNPGYVKLYNSSKGVVGIDDNGVLYFTEKPGEQLSLDDEQLRALFGESDLLLNSEFLYIYDGEFVYSYRLTEH